jgi:hypothetical protein
MPEASGAAGAGTRGTLDTMKIDTTVLLPVAAVVSSVLLLMAGRKRILELVALAASGTWLLHQLDFFKWPLKERYTQPGMLIGGALLVCGVLVYLRTSNKREVTCATVLAILGGTLLAHALAVLD